MQGNILGQSGSSVNNSLFPIYQQTTEPYEKYGVWIKNSEVIKNLYFQNDIEREEIEEATLPIGAVMQSLISIGTDIYLFGSSSSNFMKYAYKYDTVEKKFTRLADTPVKYDGSESIISIGTDIYLFGSSRTETSLAGRIAYKYDTLTDTYTMLKSNTYEMFDMAITAKGTDIYLFGSSESGDYRKRAYKYDIKTDTYTRLRDITDDLYYGSAIVIDEENIRLFGTGESIYDYAIYNYNILENSYTKLNKCYNNMDNITSINEQIYLGAINVNNIEMIMKYNAIQDTFYQYSKLQNTLKGIVGVNRKLYGVTTSKVYLLKNKIQNRGDGLYIVTNNNMLSKDMDMGSILDIIKIVDGEEQTIEAYVGDGTEWTRLN